MKRLLLNLSLAASTVLPAIAQTNATDFTANDCDGNSHNLFSELENGKVVVLTWVMPCGGCVSPSKEAYNAVEKYKTSNPDKVVAYLTDDYANTNCSSIESFANSYNLKNSTCFSSSAIKMSDYGSAGMPKVVVLAGYDHKIFYNENTLIDQQDIENAIDSALLASNISNEKKADLKLTAFPNPASDHVNVSYTLEKSSEVEVEIYNLLGDRVAFFTEGLKSQGENNLKINVNNLSKGIYTLKLKADDFDQILNLSIVD